ncbi:MAG: TrkA C-terminal domain-containing protein [Nitrospirota bacterium]
MASISAERVDNLYRELGREGYTLLVDGISVQRTPHLDAGLRAIRGHEALRHQHARGLANSSWDVREAMSARRLSQIVGNGRWQIHDVAITQGSPWIDRPLPMETPTGVCVAVRREQSLHPFTPDWRFLDGDILMVLAPPAYCSDWDQWATQGPADATAAR